MKCSLGISNFLEEISSLSHSVVFLYFFALIAEEGFLTQLSLATRGEDWASQGQPKGKAEIPVARHCTWSHTSTVSRVTPSQALQLDSQFHSLQGDLLLTPGVTYPHSPE